MFYMFIFASIKTLQTQNRGRIIVFSNLKNTVFGILLVE